MKTQQSKKNKRTDGRPARKRYWILRRLAARKIRHLMDSGYSFRGAVATWAESRGRWCGPLPTFGEIERAYKTLYRRNPS